MSNPINDNPQGRISSWALIAHEAKLEIRAGFKSGIVALAFWGLVLYLLLSLVNADYMQQMGATDVPRNSPLLIYLMGAGCMFFQFFAWAWVFSQPVLRDRKASLHEMMFTTPTSLQTMLWGRFLGAAVIGAILSASALVGILISPILAWFDLVPASAFGPTPWQALFFAWLWLQMPAAVGIGALYFAITLRTRNLAGPFALAAGLMMLWMFAVIVLRGGNINPTLAAIMDPSLFTFVYTEVNTWTPLQKSTALLPFTTGSVLNRVVWFVLPLALLLLCLRMITRESLVLEATAKPTKNKVASAKKAPKITSNHSHELPTASPASVWRSVQQLGLETRWRLVHILRSRAWWIGAGILVTMGVVSSFTQIIWHSEGPMAPRLEMLLPLLKDVVFLVIAFVIAALTGLVCRRDHVTGFDDMLSATPVADHLAIFGQALAVLAMTILLALLPSLSGILAVLLSASGPVDIGLAVSYQLLIVAAPLVELSMMVLLVHAIFRHAGLAYSMSMLVTFFLVLNHELELVHYPPYEVGITAHIQLSALSGWTPWLDYLFALDGYKLALASFMAGVAAFVVPRGLDSRMANGFAALRGRVIAPQGGLLLGASAVLLLLGGVLEQKLVQQGGYQSPQQAKQGDAQWETYWLANVNPDADFRVAGGQLHVSVDPQTQRIEGEWRLEQVRATQGLHFELPDGLHVNSVSVNDKPLAMQPGGAEQRFEHLFIPLSGCDAAQTIEQSNGCNVTINWAKQHLGWSSEGDPTGIGAEGIWLQAADIAPRLGIDPERILRVASEREAFGLNRAYRLPSDTQALSVEGVAPAGDWHWQVNIVRDGQATFLDQGQTQGPLDFSIISNGDRAHSNLMLSEYGGLRIHHHANATTGDDSVSSVAEDVSAMQACVNQQLGLTDVANGMSGKPLHVRSVAQWPRGLGETRYSGNLLQLAESPHWDIASSGTGRWLRQVDIARALARHYLIEQGDLRRMQGSAWLTDGVAGAIGLSCLASTEGLAALEQVLVRYADKTTRALAASPVPVTTLSEAPREGWSRYYAPVAALDWVLSQTPHQLHALLDDIRSRHNIPAALTAQVGAQQAADILGAPLSTQLVVEQSSPGQLRLSGQRWRWQSGGWQTVAQPARYRLLEQNAFSAEQPAQQQLNTEAVVLEQLPAEQVFALDNWPAYLRYPTQHVLRKGDAETF